MAGDFNLLFHSKLDVQVGNPNMKRKSLATRIEHKESYDLCNIWRVRNMKSRQFTFTQKQSLGLLHRRLDYIFISNTLQELVTTTEILTPISIDHCAVIFSLSKGNDCLRGKGYWKLNSSLAKYQNYITEIKILLRSFFLNRQLKWELLKYEVQKFTFNYTKQIAKEKRKQQTHLENQLIILEKCLDEDDNISKYNAIKNELDAIYDHITEGIRIRSKCNWYEHSEKSAKSFLNL